MNIAIPQDVEFILKRLTENGYSAYIVGGCVRDALLSKTPTDWDVCTNALPDETISVFSDHKILKTGIKHGTITLILNSVPYEITTFRTDGDYIDNRHPENVQYIADINGDLSRRDFTINAMAYNKKIIDLYGGQSDLDKKIIRCVGNPQKRFSEDALRIMRAIRFSSTLDFKIEEETKNAIFLLKSTLSNIAIERINIEFSRIILSDSKTVYSEYGDVFEEFLKKAACLTLEFGNTLTRLPADLTTRLAYLMLYLNFDNEQAKIALTKLRYPSKIITNVSQIIENYGAQDYKSIRGLRVLLSKIGEEILIKIINIKSVTNQNENFSKIYDMLSKIKKNKLCCTISDLDISGNDLIFIGVENGLLIGKLLEKLLYLVIDGKVKNTKYDLLETAKKLMEE